MMKPFTALVCLFRTCPIRGREHLVLLRSLASGGFWQGVTGTSEEGETPLQTASREVREETGLEPLSIKELGFSHTFSLPPSLAYKFAPGTREIKETCFMGEVPFGANVLLSSEHSEFRWLPFEEALALIHWETNRHAVRLCEESFDFQGYTL